MGANTIDELQIEVTSTTKDALSGLNKLKSSLQALSNLADSVAKVNSEGISKLKELSTSINTLSDAGSKPGLSTAISELKKLSNIDFSNLSNGSSQIKDIAKAIESLPTKNISAGVTQPVVPTATVPISAGTEVEKMKSGLSGLKAVASGVWGTIRSGASAAFGALKTVGSTALRAITSGFKLAAKGVGKLLSGVGQLVRAGWSKLTASINGVNKKLGGLVRSFGRVMFYRAIRSVISQITAAFKEGTNNIYQYSKALGGELAQSMDRIATSMQYFKNSIGAMVAPLINALAPAIEFVIDKVVSLINYLNQLFSKITGKSTWTKAVKVQKEYAESATEAAEAVNSLTAGFDELNVLSDSGSQSGGSDTPDYGSMFEEVPLDSSFASWVDDIKKMIEAGDWSGLGKYLGEKINDLVDAIDWAGWGTKLGKGIQAGFEFTYAFLDTINFDKIGSSIATLLNNAIAEIDFSLVGKTLSKHITIIVDTLHGFVSTLDWKSVGLAIGNFINGAIEEISLEKIVDTLQTTLFGVYTALQTAVATIKWEDLGKDIADGLNRIEIDTIVIGFFTTMGEAFSGLLTTLKTVAQGLDWNALGAELANCINAIDLTEFSTQLFGTASEIAVGLLTAISTALEEANFVDVGRALFDGIAAGVGEVDAGKIVGMLIESIIRILLSPIELLWGLLDAAAKFGENLGRAIGESLMGQGENIWEGLWLGIVDATVNLANWIEEYIYDPFVDFFRKVFGIASPAKEMKPLGEYIIEGVLEGIKSAWESITSFFPKKLEEIKKTITTAWNGVKENTLQKWSEIKSDLTQKWSEIKTTASTKWSEMKTKASETWDSIKTSASTTWTNIKTTASTKWSEIKTTVGDKWSEISSSASETFSSVKTSISGVWDDISEKITSVASSIWDTLSGWWEDIKGLFSGLGDYLDGVKETVSDAWDTVTDVASNIGNSIADGVGNVIDWAANVMGFADGGFPDQGQLFIARERGAELVGNIGGRTAVANNDQIVEGIYQAVLAAMQDSEGGDTSVNVYLDGKQITAAVEKRQRERGATIYTGGVLV